jgi:hypothetical protein
MDWRWRCFSKSESFIGVVPEKSGPDGSGPHSKTLARHLGPVNKSARFWTAAGEGQRAHAALECAMRSTMQHRALCTRPTKAVSALFPTSHRTPRRCRAANTFVKIRAIRVSFDFFV